MDHAHGGDSPCVPVCMASLLFSHHHQIENAFRSHLGEIIVLDRIPPSVPLIQKISILMRSSTAACYSGSARLDNSTFVSCMPSQWRQRIASSPDDSIRMLLNLTFRIVVSGLPCTTQGSPLRILKSEKLRSPSLGSAMPSSTSTLIAARSESTTTLENRMFVTCALPGLSGGR